MPEKIKPIGPSTGLIRNYLHETTGLNPQEERKYQNWVKHYKVKDIDPKTGEPYDDVFYDMRGYWKENQGPPGMIGYGPPQFEGQHGPDTYKQHGHDTFSRESKYSKDPTDPMWIPGSEVRLEWPKKKNATKK